MKFAKIAVLFVAMTFVAGQTMAVNRKATFDQLARGIKTITDEDPTAVISRSTIIYLDVKNFLGNPAATERFA